MKGIILDMQTLKPEELDFSGLESELPHWTYYEQTEPDDIESRLAGVAVAVTNKVALDADALAGARDLELVCIAATGTDHVDLKAARQRGVVVCNVSGYSTETVAQHTLALMLGLATRWHQYDREARQAWPRASMFCRMDHPVFDLNGKTLGLIGHGDLGRRVEALARALGMRVLVAQSLRPDATPDPARVPLRELLTRSDLVSLHCPLTPQTDQLVNADFLAAMKPGACLINTARGGLVDEPALAEALRSGQLGGAALDVLSEEPPPADHPLLAEDLPNLIITPHSAWLSTEARQRLLDGVVANLRAWKHGRPINVVNGLTSA